MKPSILFIAASCYPIDGAEANVNAKVIKALTDYGCTVDLISRKSAKSLCYPKSTEEYYFGKVRNIIEVDWYTKKDLKRIWNHIKVLLKAGYTYVWADWALPAIRKCETLIAENHYDYIYSYNAPSEIVALYLHKKYNIKWVATWNDPYCWNKYPAPYGEGKTGKVSFFRQRLIDNIGHNVHRNIFPSVRLRDYMAEYMKDMPVDKGSICPHIVLENDSEHTLRKDNDTLKIIHAGALGRERSPMTFLIGLRDFINNYQDAKIKISLLGVFERCDGVDAKKFIIDNDLSAYIDFLSPVTYRDSLNIIAENDVCLIIEAPCDEGIFLPSKVADYMQIDKPIFAISPQNGTLNDLYNADAVGYFADVTDPHDIAMSLNQIYQDFTKSALRKAIQDKKFTKENYIETQIKEIWT